MKAVELKNGTQEADVLVKTTMMLLGVIAEQQPMATLNLVMRCRDSDYKYWGNSEQILKDNGLITHGVIHDSVRNVVLSAFEGEGLGIKLVNPLAE